MIDAKKGNNIETITNVNAIINTSENSGTNIKFNNIEIIDNESK